MAIAIQKLQDKQDRVDSAKVEDVHSSFIQTIEVKCKNSVHGQL